MADRFGDWKSVLIETFKDNAKNKITKLSTATRAKGMEDLGEGKGS